jgi:hypothetical protein
MAIAQSSVWVLIRLQSSIWLISCRVIRGGPCVLTRLVLIISVPDQSLPHLILICPALTSSPPGPLISSQSFALALFPVQPAMKASLALARSAFSLIQIGSLGSLVSIAEKSLDFGLNILDQILCFLSNGRDGPKVG